MSKMTLTKEQALEVLDDESTHLSYREVGRSRWAMEYELVFKRDDKLWAVVYRRGTGDEGETPFEHDGDNIACTEVEEYEVTKKAYRAVRP